MTTEPARDPVRRHARTAGVAALIGFCAITVVWAFQVPWAAARNPDAVYDDQRGWVSHFHRYHEPATSVEGDDDLFVRITNATAPLGYRWLLRTAARIAPPVAVTKWVGLAGAVVTLVALGYVAAYWFGAEMGLAVGALAAHAYIFIDRAAGGLHRTAGYPLVALTVWALARGRPAYAAWAAGLGMLFYPPVAPLAATVAAVLLLQRRPLFDRAARREWGHCGAAAVVCVGAAAVWLRGLAQFGPSITFAQAAASPLWQRAGGRYHFLPFLPPLREIADAVRLGFQPGLTALPSLSLWCVAGVIAGAMILSRDRWAPVPRRLWLLAGVGLGWYFLARAVAFRLNFPVRNLTLILPVVALLLWAWAWHALWHRWAPGASGVWPAVCALVLGVALGGRQLAAQPATHLNAAPLRPLLEVLRTLPDDAVLSGPPRRLDTITALAHRRAYVSYEVLLPQRPRLMAKLLDRLQRHYAAYYASDPAPLARLHAEGVDYMLVYQGDFRPIELRYARLFEPISTYMQSVIARNRGRGFWLANPPPEVVIADAPPYRVVDLAAVAALAAGSPTSDASGGGAAGTRGGSTR